MRKELCDILSKYRPQLVEGIDPENGLLNDLTARNVLTRRQAKSIEVLPDPYKQVETLLDMLRRRPDEDFDSFCEALCKHGQDDVVDNYLKVKIEENSEENEGETDPYKMACTASRIMIRNSTKEFYLQNKAEAYPMCNSSRGRCYIFNVNIVEGMERRHGSEEDLQNLKELFSRLHFVMDTFTNPTAQDIRDKMAEISGSPHLWNDQCLVLFFLSHGRVVMEMTTHGHTAVEYIYGSDGEQVKTEDILRPLTNSECESMRGKPKLIFFQACREYSSVKQFEKMVSETCADAVGGLPEFIPAYPPHGTGIQESSSFPAPSTSPSVAPQPVVPISLKDFVIGYSTESGYLSFRDTNSGSWYISAIVSVFCQSVHNMDLCAMLRKVNGLIGERRPVGLLGNQGLGSGGQVASHVDSLTKPYLYFFPGIIEDRTAY